jgi:ribonuclease P protein component
LLRLCKRHEFEAVFAYGCVVSGRLFVVRAKPNGRNSPRLGIVASKKALRRAVDRNRGKRLARETFRLAQDDLAALDIIVQLRSELAKRDNRTVRQELLALFVDLGARLAARVPKMPAGRNESE